MAEKVSRALNRLFTNEAALSERFLTGIVEDFFNDEQLQTEAETEVDASFSLGMYFAAYE